jgi:CHAD domain-containing protein
VSDRRTGAHVNRNETDADGHPASAAGTRDTLATVKETLEREVKLTPSAGFVMPELGGERLATRTFVSTYHDTDDLFLARHGLTLRHRVEAGAGVWQLKLPGAASRVELELPGTPARPPLELASLLLGFLRGRDVAPVARLRTRREVVRADGAEIVDDSVSVLAGQRVTGRFRELEIELTDGDGKTLRRLERELRRAGAEPSAELRPKLHRALDLDAPRPLPAARRATAPAAALALALGEQARRLLLHDPGVRLGSDAEELHRLRVATRRLRALLRAGRELLDPAWSEPLRDELRWLGRALGPARDLDVLLGRLTADIASLDAAHDDVAGLLEDLAAERAAARLVVVDALSSDRYLALLGTLDDAGRPQLSGVEQALGEVFRGEWRRTRKAFARLGDDPPDEELHAFRIRVKRSRYAAELAEHELGKGAHSFLAAAKALQDVLGEHQDATVTGARLASWAAGGAAGDGATALLERERERQAEARAAWPAAWKALRRSAKALA